MTVTPPTPVSRSRRVLVALGVVLATPACDSTAPAGPPAALEIVSGDAQSGVIGRELAQALVARVKDSAGNPVKGQTVVFKVTAGGGSMFAGVGTTNDTGIVQDRWTLGTGVGDTQRVEVRAVNAETGAPLVFGTFTAIATAGIPASIAIVSGDSASQQVVSPPDGIHRSVRVAEADGRGAPSVVVTFTVTSGGGTLSFPTSVTDTGGVAVAPNWYLGSVVGTNTLRATAAGLPDSSVTFTAFGIANLTKTLAVVAGNNQTATKGTAVAVAVQVVAKDAFGNVVPGQVVTFTVIAGGGSVTGATPTTNSAGVATLGSWTLGPTATTNTLKVTADPAAAGFTLLISATGQ